MKMMMFIKLVSAVSVLGLPLVYSCAKEVSDEDRRREESDRELARLAAAEGSFPGFVRMSDSQGVPFRIDIQSKRNPQSGLDKPTLNVAMNIGFFGGVSLVASEANYDWGSGKLTATFSSSSGPGAGGGAGAGSTANTFEIQMTGLKDKKSFQKAMIKGSVLGERSLTSLDYDPITRDENSFSFPMVFSLGAENQTAILNLKRLNVDVPAPSNSDMPTLPPIRSSLLFTTAANVSQEGILTWYDPLAGTLDIQLRENTWLRIAKLYAPVDQSQQTLADVKVPEYDGSVYIGGRSAYAARLNFDTGRFGLASYELRTLPKYYLGTYKGSSEGLELRAIAALTDNGTTVENPSDIGIPSSPSLQLKLMYCLDGRTNYAINATIFALDYLAGQMRFREDGLGKRLTQVNISQNWLKLDGIITDQSGAIGGNARNPVYQLQALSTQSTPPTCTTNLN